MNNETKMNLEEVKEVAFNILKDVDKICRDNHITYFIFYGTLLGAVRHGGFIPWDDDIDIVMPRDDYNKLLKVMEKNIGRLRMISPESTHDTIYPHGKIIDTNTKLYLKHFRTVDGYGIGIDVFPFDYMDNNSKIREKGIRKAKNLKRIIEHTARTKVTQGSSTIRNLIRYILYACTRFINVSKVVNKLNMINVNNKPSDYMGLSFDIALLVDKLYPTQDILFNGYLVKAPKDIDYCLKACYGDNYMTPPPKEERVIKHCYDAYYIPIK